MLLLLLDALVFCGWVARFSAAAGSAVGVEGGSLSSLHRINWPCTGRVHFRKMPLFASSLNPLHILMHRTHGLRLCPPCRMGWVLPLPTADCSAVLHRTAVWYACTYAGNV